MDGGQKKKWIKSKLTQILAVPLCEILRLLNVASPAQTSPSHPGSS